MGGSVMAKRREMNEEEFQEHWKTMPDSDQHFLVAMDLVCSALNDRTLHYHKLPSRVDKLLQTADRDTLFSIASECIGRLLDAPAIQRIRDCHSYRNNQPSSRKQKRKP